MSYTLKNTSGFPLDVPTLSGPVILPAYGEVIADLGAFDAEVMRQSPYVEISEGGAIKRDPLDHDGNGKKGGAAPPIPSPTPAPPPPAKASRRATKRRGK